MAKIDFEKILIKFLNSPFNKQFDEKLKSALKEQGLEYKDGEIVKTQRRVAAEAKEAIFDNEDEGMISALLEGFKYHQLFSPTFGGVPDTEIIAWLEKQKYTQRDVDDAYLKGVTDTKHELEKQGEKKSTWSEEDEDKFNKVIDELTPFGECPDNPDWEQREYYHGRDAMINWLKSIKDRLKGE